MKSFLQFPFPDPSPVHPRSGVGCILCLLCNLEKLIGHLQMLLSVKGSRTCQSPAKPVGLADQCDQLLSLNCLVRSKKYTVYILVEGSSNTYV